MNPSRIQERYSHGEGRPLRGYLGAISVYGGVVAGLAGVAAVRGRPLPERPTMQDVALICLATHKLSRLIAKDPITSPLRAPFTRYDGVGGEAELAETVVGDGTQHAVGELLTCPFCLAQWVATGFAFGLVFAPRATRLAATVFTAVGVSDFLQFGYDALQPSD